MPKYLKEFLEGLTDEQADELWEYLDTCDNGDMVEIIALSHEKVSAKQMQTGEIP